MASNQKNTRNSQLSAIERAAREREMLQKDKFERRRQEIQRKKDDIADDKSRASWPETLKLQDEAERLDADLVMLNREEADMRRLLELERREKIGQLGTSYVPAFDGIVQGAYGGLDSSGNHYASYGGKQYKAVSMGATSIPKGTLVQIWFSGNSYHITW